MTQPFEPARTLFVAKSWPSTANSNIIFTTITDALAHVSSAQMNPVEGNPVAVIIFPGTYTENIDIPSWVFLSSGSTEQNAVTMKGNVTWTPKGAAFEQVQLYFLNIGPIAVTTTEKTDGQTTFTLHGCFVDGLTVNGRSAAEAGPTRDLVHAAKCIPGRNAFTLNKCQFEWLAGRLSGMTFNDCRFRIIGSTTIPNPQVPGWSVNGTSTGICTGDNFTSGWTLGSGTSVVFGGCSLSALIVAAYATADIRSSECPDSALSGQGTVSRRSLTTSFGPTVSPPSANRVMFAPPFPDDDYTVSLQLTAGPGNPRVTASGKTGAGFTINDAVGGNTYDVTVIQGTQPLKTTGWRHNDLSQATGAIAISAAGKPAGFTWDVDSTQHVVYRDTDGHIHQLWFSFDGGWRHEDLMQAPGVVGAPNAASDLAGFTWDVDSTVHVVYRGTDGHIHQLWFSFDGGWRHEDLSQATGAIAIRAAGEPAGYTWDVDSTVHVVYRGTDGHIHQLWFSLA